MTVRKASLQAVIDAADRIDAAGKKVTQRGIRNELGGGSWSDIKDGWNEWVKIHDKLYDEKYSGAAADEIIHLKSEMSKLTDRLENERKAHENIIRQKDSTIKVMESTMKIMEERLARYAEDEQKIRITERWQSKIRALDFDYHLKCVEIEALRKLDDGTDYGFSVKERINEVENIRKNLFDELTELRVSDPLDDHEDKKTNLEER